MLVLQVTTTGLGFLINLLLARLLGVAGYGAYAYAYSWVYLLAIPATLGLGVLLVRKVAVYRARSNWGLISGLLRWSNQAVLLTSVGLTLIAVAAGWFFGKHYDTQMLSAFFVAMSSLPLVALTTLRGATMQGLRRVVSGQSLELLIRPLLFIALIGSAYLVLGNSLNASWAVGLNVAATGVAFLIGARLLRQALPQAVKQAYPLYRGREWMRSAWPLLLLSGMAVINAQGPTLLLGAMKGAEEAGIYVVAERSATLLTFITGAVSAVLRPTIATLHLTGDTEQLQRIITNSTRLVLIFSAPIALCFILFNHFWLLLFFGEGFTRGGAALAILSLGYLVNAAMGLVATLLLMTGYERDAAVGVGVSAVLSVVLNFALIPRWGLEGAATAAATSMIVWNLLLTVLVHRRLGIHASALGRLG